MSLRFTSLDTLPILPTKVVIDFATSRGRLEDEIVALFDQFRDPLLRYLSSIGVALLDGEKILQEVFLSLFQHLKAGKPRDNLRGWLFRVTHNLALKERYRTRRSLEALSEIGSTEDLAVDPAPSPEERLVTKVMQRRLQAFVRTLPEQDRKCLFCGPKGCDIARSPRFSIFPSARVIFPGAISDAYGARR